MRTHLQCMSKPASVCVRMHMCVCAEHTCPGTDAGSMLLVCQAKIALCYADQMSMAHLECQAKIASWYLTRYQWLTWNLSSSSAKAAGVSWTVGDLLKTVPSTWSFSTQWIFFSLSPGRGLACTTQVCPFSACPHRLHHCSAKGTSKHFLL